HGNLRELAADLLDHAREIVVGEESDDCMTRANLPRSVIDRAKRPRFREHAREMRAERRRPRVARLQVIETLREIGRETRAVDRVLPKDEREVAVGRVEKLREVVLDLDVVMRAGEAQSSRRLDGAARRRVELGDESTKIDGHKNEG